MKLVGIVLSYVLAVGILFSALVGGATWLVQPGPAISQEARPAAIPPRIADSIERKKPIPVPAEERKPEPLKPAMQEANASLAPAPARSAKIRELSAPSKQARKRRGEQPLALETPAAAVASPAAAVSTARSDFPY